jgi:hypothetical protein
MNTLQDRPRRWLLVLVLMSALMLVVGVGVALSTNYQTWYCGDPSSPCLLGSGSAVSTASVALRDNNNVSCNTACHAHVWYDQGNGAGAYDITHTAGACCISINQGSGGYAYSKCETDSGFGSNYATCETLWHT